MGEREKGGRRDQSIYNLILSGEGKTNFTIQRLGLSNPTKMKDRGM